MKENDIRLNVTINTKIGNVRQPRSLQNSKYFFDRKRKKNRDPFIYFSICKNCYRAAEFLAERKMPNPSERSVLEAWFILRVPLIAFVLFCEYNVRKTELSF